MNFFTFSSDPHRRFVLWLLVFVWMSVAGLFILGVYFQPLYGDLTRIGNFTEREFGWNRPQRTFLHTKLDFPGSDKSGKYGDYYDVLVLGDSFSNVRPEFQWQNYLAASSGWTVATLNINRVRLQQILTSRTFLEHPPKVLVFESVERELPNHLMENNLNSNLKIQNHKQSIDNLVRIDDSPKTEDKIPGQIFLIYRNTPLKEIKIDYVWKLIWNNVLRNFGINYSPYVYKLPLIKSAPFSSRNQREILVYKDDLQKVKIWNHDELFVMNDYIKELRSIVESNGYTRFVLMVVPDKLSAYSDYLKDIKLRNISLLSGLSDLQPDTMPRFDNTLISEINAGKMDVYLPDDTHWGSAGQCIAANTLTAFLLPSIHGSTGGSATNKNILRPNQCF